MRNLKSLILGALATVGACVVQAEMVSYLDPVFDAKGAVSGYVTKSAECTELPSRRTTHFLVSGWYCVDGAEVVLSTLLIAGDVHLILKDKSQLEVNTHDESRGGLRVEEGNSLTIYAQSEGDTKGRLYA